MQTLNYHPASDTDINFFARYVMEQSRHYDCIVKVQCVNKEDAESLLDTLYAVSDECHDVDTGHYFNAYGEDEEYGEWACEIFYAAAP
ncbi:MAG: hypothetical protein DDT25_00606 [Chloroflexi bacterium]|nr:hypothetical protein [Chloroflexota bacterium]